MTEPKRQLAGEDMLPLNKCCPVRQKVALKLDKVLHVDFCGVPDTELLSVLRFNPNEKNTTPTLCFNYCPWCGEALKYPTEDQIASNQHTTVKLEKGKTYTSVNNENWFCVKTDFYRAVMFRNSNDRTYPFYLNGIPDSSDHEFRLQCRIKPSEA